MRVLDDRSRSELAAEGLEDPHPQPHARRAGQRHLLLVRAGPLYGEQLQLAPGGPHGDGLATAGGAGVPLGAGPGALPARHVGWAHPLRRRAGGFCPLPVLGAAHRAADPCTGGRRGSAVADAAVPAGAVLCGRFGSLERCALHKDCAGCINVSAAAWLNCSKQHTIPRENSTKAKKYENDLLIFWQTLESLAVLD